MVAEVGFEPSIMNSVFYNCATKVQPPTLTQHISSTLVKIGENGGGVEPSKLTLKVGLQ
jgi:hypothetical protein